MATLPLHDIGIAEFLEGDARPAFILDLERTQDPYNQRLHIVFSNASLQRVPHILDLPQLRKDDPADGGELGHYLQFKEWATNPLTRGHIADAYSIPFRYQNISWTCSTLRKRWRVVSGSVGSVIGLRDTSPGSFPSPPSGTQKEDQDRNTASKDDRAGKEIEKQHTKLHPTWVEDLPASEHVQFFKGIDWSATALGPLDTWTDCARQMTRLLMSDSRAACVLWYKPSIA